MLQAEQDKYEYYAMMTGVISPILEYKPVIPDCPLTLSSGG